MPPPARRSLHLRIAAGAPARVVPAQQGTSRSDPHPGHDTRTKLDTVLAELKAEYQAAHSFPWIVGYSGGKDSTLLLQLVFETILALPRSARIRPVHVVCNDTLVESPLVADYVDRMLIRLRGAVEALDVPVMVARTTPPVDHTFWVNLIGRGYGSPHRRFRWCTDRLKIRPTSTYIRSKVAESGQVILLLGVRRHESAARAASASRYDRAGSRVHPHNDLAGCLVYRPIVDFTTEEVWQLLLQRRPPWGGTHRDLITLYRNAQGGECPMVIDRDQAPSCGTSSSRFGCWTCTVVAKDRSAEGFVDAGFDELEPLLEFRDWLAEIRVDPTRRMMLRRNGRITRLANGSYVPGPFTLAARREILERLLRLQEEVGRPLITAAEVDRIRALWASDAVESTKHILRITGLGKKES